MYISVYSTLAKCCTVKIQSKLNTKIKTLYPLTVWFLTLGPRKRHHFNIEKKYEGGGKLSDEKRRRKKNVTLKFKNRSGLWQNRAVQATSKLWKAANALRVRWGKQETGLLLQMSHKRTAQKGCCLWQ